MLLGKLYVKGSPIFGCHLVFITKLSKRFPLCRFCYFKQESKFFQYFSPLKISFKKLTNSGALLLLPERTSQLRHLSKSKASKRSTSWQETWLTDQRASSSILQFLKWIRLSHLIIRSSRLLCQLVRPRLEQIWWSVDGEQLRKVFFNPFFFPILITELKKYQWKWVFWQ